jgi:hypothetical protein
VHLLAAQLVKHSLCAHRYWHRKPVAHYPVQANASLRYYDRQMPMQFGRDARHELARELALDKRLRDGFAMLSHVGHHTFNQVRIPRSAAYGDASRWDRLGNSTGGAHVLLVLVRA